MNQQWIGRSTQPRNHYAPYSPDQSRGLKGESKSRSVCVSLMNKLSNEKENDSDIYLIGYRHCLIDCKSQHSSYEWPLAVAWVFAPPPRNLVSTEAYFVFFHSISNTTGSSPNYVSKKERTRDSIVYDNHPWFTCPHAICFYKRTSKCVNHHRDTRSTPPLCWPHLNPFLAPPYSPHSPVYHWKSFAVSKSRSK